MYKSCGLLLFLSSFTLILHHKLRETILYKSCGLLLSLSPFTQILHHQLRGIILYKSCGLLLSLSPFTQIIHNWLRENILYKSCGLLLSLSSVTWILHHQLRGIISYSVNAGFKRFYRVLRGVKKISCFDPCISRVRFLEVNFGVKKSTYTPENTVSHCCILSYMHITSNYSTIV